MRSTNQQIMDEGEAKGIAHGETKTLLRQLELRFGPLDDATRDRVHAGSAEDRARWVERVLTARTLADVFTAG